MTDRAKSKCSEDNLPHFVYHRSSKIYILKLSQELNSIQSSPAGSYAVLCIVLCCSMYKLCCYMYCLCRLCCSMYCLCVNVYYTTATGCQPNCS